MAQAHAVSLEKEEPGAYKPEHLESVKLPEFGYVFFNHLMGEYDALKAREGLDTEAYRKAGHLKEIYLSNARPITWGDLTLLECLVLRLRSADEIRERIRTLQTRYKNILPRNLSQEFDVNRISRETLSDEQVRVRAEALACEFFKLCVLKIHREKLRATASSYVFAAMGVFGVVYLSALAMTTYFGPSWQPIRMVAAIMFLGAMGGFVSSQQRIQNVGLQGESFVGIIELSSLKRIMASLTPAILGAIFAFLLYVMCVSRLLSGGIFPTLPELDPKDVGVLTKLFCQGCSPSAIPEDAKLVIWCFIAGFAERFVPQTLARFVSEGKQHR